MCSCVGGRLDSWANGRMSEWMGEWVTGCVSGCPGGRWADNGCRQNGQISTPKQSQLSNYHRFNPNH